MSPLADTISPRPLRPLGNSDPNQNQLLPTPATILPRVRSSPGPRDLVCTWWKGWGKGYLSTFSGESRGGGRGEQVDDPLPPTPAPDFPGYEEAICLLEMAIKDSRLPDSAGANGEVILQITVLDPGMSKTKFLHPRNLHRKSMAMVL